MSKVTSNSAPRIADLRREMKAAQGVASRARETILTLKAKRWGLGSTASDRAKDKRAAASIIRLEDKLWRAERTVDRTRAEIRSMGGTLR